MQLMQAMQALTLKFLYSIQSQMICQKFELLFGQKQKKAFALVAQLCQTLAYLLCINFVLKVQKVKNCYFGLIKNQKFANQSNGQMQKSLG